MPDVEPVTPGASNPFSAAFTITNPSPFMTMHNVLWYCTMIPLNTSHQIPVVDLGQFQNGRIATEIAPNRREQHGCRETGAIRQAGVYEISVSVDFQLVIQVMSFNRVLKRSFKSSDLTWIIGPDGGHWSR